MFEIPILLIIYKRKESTLRLLEQIKKIQPRNLFVAADGPKNEADYPLCEETRALFDKIEWDETVLHKKFQEKNIGVGLGPKTALDWFFEHNEMGIILEDDIFPSLDFFYFCEELLAKYRENHTIMHINAMNFLRKKNVISDSYYFSKVTSPWGWATWRRAWKMYDFNMTDLSVYIDKLDIPKFYKTEFINYKKLLDSYNNPNELFAWDYQWLYCVLKNKGMGIVPAKNLALNMGFKDTGASNTYSTPEWANRITLESLKISKHPDEIKINEWADELTFKEIVGNYSPNYFKWLEYIRNKLF